MKHGKKYVDGAKLIERSRLYDTQEALDLCVKTGTAKFDETVEVHVKLGVDGRHAAQQVRGAIVLPHGTGKTVRVLAICKPEKEDEARAAGAEFVGGNDMIQKIQSEGWMDFDVLITTPDMMGMVGRLGKILGPRGLMPNPKAGTVAPDIARAITEAKAGRQDQHHPLPDRQDFLRYREADGKLQHAAGSHQQGKAGCCKGPVHPFLCCCCNDGPGREDQPEQGWLRFV